MYHVGRKGKIFCGWRGEVCCVIRERIDEKRLRERGRVPVCGRRESGRGEANWMGGTFWWGWDVKKTMEWADVVE